MISSMCLIAGGYPTPGQPMFQFVKNLADGMCEQDVHVTVIAPQSLTNILVRGTQKRKYYQRYYIDNGKTYDVYSPTYITFSNFKFAGISLLQIARNNFVKSVLNVVNAEKLSFDVVYGHFVVLPGAAAVAVGELLGIPAFIGYGESDDEEIVAMDKYGAVSESIKKATGIIAVATASAERLLKLYGNSIQNKILIAPNGYSPKAFKVINREIIRRELNIPKDVFIVAFVGAFTERKGSMRLACAINKTKDVYSFFIGKGSQSPSCQNILFKGSVNNEVLYKYLNSANVFVLPTLKEGCPNVVIEAMACGLPIISSNMPFNYDILDKTNAILINPKDIEALAQAITKLKDDIVLRNKLAYASNIKSKAFTIAKRCIKILEFMNNRK